MVHRLLPRKITREMMIPLRVKGPILNPGAPLADPVLFFDRFGSNLAKLPRKMIQALPINQPSKQKEPRR